MREAVRAHEGRALAELTEAQTLELHHHDDRVVVVGLDEVDVARLRVPSVARHRIELRIDAVCRVLKPRGREA